MKKTLKNIFAMIACPIVVGPVRSFRIARRGAVRVSEFRAEHGREPTEQEWQEISMQVGNEIMSDTTSS